MMVTHGGMGRALPFGAAMMCLGAFAQAETLCFPLTRVPSRSLTLQVAEKGCDYVFMESGLWLGHDGRFSSLLEKGWRVVRLSSSEKSKPVYVLSKGKSVSNSSTLAADHARSSSHGVFLFAGAPALKVVVPDVSTPGVASEEAWLAGDAISHLAGPWVAYASFPLPADNPGWVSWTGRKIGDYYVNVAEKAFGRFEEMAWLIY